MYKLRNKKTLSSQELCTSMKLSRYRAISLCLQQRVAATKAQKVLLSKPLCRMPCDQCICAFNAAAALGSLLNMTYGRSHVLECKHKVLHHNHLTVQALLTVCKQGKHAGNSHATLHCTRGQANLAALEAAVAAAVLTRPED